MTNETNDLSKTETESDGQVRGKDFLRLQIDEDLRTNKYDGRVVTRFPPEPNGYLHIGHAKSICLNFGLAKEYGGTCHLRFDDTNPTKESDEFVQSIQEDVRWLGYDWGENLFFASDYFDQLYEFAIQLINDGKAYVDDQTGEEIRKNRGTLNEPGLESPFRNRSVEENLDLFTRMKNGEFENGTKVLRAKIDMASPNMNMRDPVIYRVLNAHHHRTGDKWHIYPMYDFTHGQSDSIERITNSICTLEFADHRPLYEWFIDQLGIYAPKQIEFARLNLSHTVMSKRKLLELVQDNHVDGWDDPRMPTISGLRRRGIPAEAVRAFCDRIGVAKRNNMVEMALLEFYAREHLNKVAPRFMGVLKPLKVTITNYPEGQVEYLDAVNNPEDESAGTRKVPFGREIFIEQDDFMEEPAKKFFRLSPGQEVRLRWAYYITCNEVVKNDAGEIVELLCTYDPETKGGDAPDGRKVKATLHFVEATHAKEVEVRNYNTLFTKENPNKVEEGEEWTDAINPESLEILSPCYVEPAVQDLEPGQRFQFERLGYYCIDSKHTTADKQVINRTVTLRDAWAKIQNKQPQKQKKQKQQFKKQK